MQPFLQILENILLLSLLGPGYYFINSLRSTVGKDITNVLHGVMFGLIAFLVTATHVDFLDGSTVDARAAPVILAGYVGGPVSAGIAAIFGGFARGLAGSAFAFSGIVVFFVYAVIGTGFWSLRRGENPEFINPARIGQFCLASCIGAASMFFLISPGERALRWLQSDLPYIFAANCIGIIVAMLVLGATVTLLRKSNEVNQLYETLSLAKHAAGFGIWEYNLNTGVLNWDDRSRELFGIDKNDFSGTFADWEKKVHPDDLPRAREAFWRAVQGEETYASEYRVIHDDGRQATIRGTAVMLRDTSGEATRVVGTNQDLTTIRTAEAKLQEAQQYAIEAQKFENIGKLTGGVAHDFNNLLAVIMGNLELAGEELNGSSPDKREIQSLLDASLEATRRGAGLTRNMLAYARKARLNPEELNINETVRETEVWMRRTIPSKIEIETRLQSHLWPILVDKSSLQSALINLLLNARDAFEGSGKVIIETRNADMDEDVAADQPDEVFAGRYVTLVVSDNGRGIDAAAINSIFDPYFTTKGVGEGSGLGLSMVQGFVKQSGGTIRVQSQPGVGTKFTMYFPVAWDAQVASVPKVEVSENHAVGTGNGSRLMVVEDRDEVLSILQKTLSSAGYTVVTARSGDEGYAIYCNDPNFDLIVTDVVMPGDLQGPDMAQKIRSKRPDMKFVFLSGYANSEATNDMQLKPNDVRLTKPVERSELLTTISRALAH